MYKNVPTYTSGQELATRYWWNLTQLAAAAAQDVFLIVYSTLEGTDNGTKSIADYSLDNQKGHMTKELIDEGYDKKKFTSRPSDVFFDLQLTRKIMDKILITDENSNIIEKIRKKIRWLTYQRNDVCHEMLSSLEILKLKLKLGTLKGVLRQLYNLASQFSNLSKDTVNEALESFLEELDIHRSITTMEKRFRCRRIRKTASVEKDSEDSEDTEKSEDSLGESYNSFDRDGSTDKSEVEDTSDKSGKFEFRNNYDNNKQVVEIMHENNQNTIKDWENRYINRFNDGMSDHHIDITADCYSGTNADEESSFTNRYTDGTFQEAWSLQGSNLMVQIGLYCSKGFKNQFENVQTTLESGHKLMVFWQQCLCDSHRVEKPSSKSCFVPPRVSIRTRSKSLGRKASWYLLRHQRLARQRYKAKKEKIATEKRSLWNVLNDIATVMPEIQKGVFGNKWEDIVRREEAIVTVENWDVLVPEEEWINEGWGDFQDLSLSSEINKENSHELSEEKDEVDVNITGKPTEVKEHEDATGQLCRCQHEYFGNFSSEDVDRSYGKKTICFLSLTVILLIFILVVSIFFSTLVISSLALVFVGKVFTVFVNLLAFLSLFWSLGCGTFIVFLAVKFLLVLLVSLIKITSVLLYFIQYCKMLENRSYKAVQRLNVVE